MSSFSATLLLTVASRRRPLPAHATAELPHSATLRTPERATPMRPPEPASGGRAGAEVRACEAKAARLQVPHADEERY
jgi:hypothetical protein